MGPNNPLRLQLGRARVDLVGDWDHEIDVVSRAPEVDGYRCNVRLTVRGAEGPISIDDLVAAYAGLLEAGIDGKVELVKKLPRTGRGADQMVEVSFVVELDQGRQVRHGALIAVYDQTVVTAAASQREGAGEDVELRDALWSVLRSLRIDGA